MPALIYPDASDVRRVDPRGSIKWRNTAIFISTNIAGDYVSVTEMVDDIFTIAYGKLQLGEFDCTTKRFTPRVRWSS